MVRKFCKPMQMFLINWDELCHVSSLPWNLSVKISEPKIFLQKFLVILSTQNRDTIFN